MRVRPRSKYLPYENESVALVELDGTFSERITCINHLAKGSVLVQAPSFCTGTKHFSRQNTGRLRTLGRP
jgi:hypothetical protein